METRHFAHIAVAAAVITATLTAVRADAYQIESPMSTGCHERITLRALDGAGWPDGQRPPEVGRADRAVVEDLPFRVPERARDLWTLSLLLGSRDNDLHGFAIEDFAATTNVHNDPDGQAAHCLRSPWDDGAQGDFQAMQECQAFILDELAEALGDEDEIDLDATDVTPVALAFRGRVDISVSRFAFHTGKALHALEDGFTHTFRSEDGMKVRHVMNWVDWAVDPHYSVARDGHAHMSALDACDGETEAQRRREALTTEAGTALLDAIADPTGGREGRLERARAVLVTYLSVEPGCTAENDWCDAPELAEAEPGCSAMPGLPAAPGRGWTTVGLLAVVGLVVRSVRRTTARA